MKKNLLRSLAVAVILLSAFSSAYAATQGTDKSTEKKMHRKAKHAIQKPAVTDYKAGMNGIPADKTAPVTQTK